jgi:hypothetical protein
LSDHKKLILKLSKQVNNAADLNPSYVKLHYEALLDLDPLFSEIISPQKGLKMADNHIRAILDWSLTYGKYAS